MAALPTPSAAAPAAELKKALDANLARLRSAQAYVRRLRERDDIEAAIELTEACERIDALLDERVALRARL
jgi:hypothetical protein